MEPTTKAKSSGGSRLQPSEKKSRAPLIAVAAVTAVAVGAYLGLCAWADRQQVFFPGYEINGVDVAGLSVQQAQSKLEQELPAKAIRVYDEEASSSAIAEMTLDDLGFSAEAVSGWAKSCMDRQHTGSFFSKGPRYLSSMLGQGESAKLQYKLDEEAVQWAAQSVSDQLSTPAVDAAFTVQEASVLLTKGQDGRQVDAKDLAKKLRTAGTAGEDSVSVRFETVSASPISLQAIHDEIAGEMRNASYDPATNSIIPEQTGADFDLAAAQSLLDEAAPGETVTVPAKIEYPSVTAESLRGVLFRDVLGECKTHVSGSAARVSNVKLAASAFNGVVLNSGELFSYNGTVGKRTIEKGYKAAPAYVQGETVDEIGGGVCQPSSTLYLACLRADLEITERYAHRYVPSYIPKGMDATVSWGGPDYKFTNNTDYPIKLVTSYDGGYLTVKILGTKVNSTHVEVTFEQLSSTAWQTVYQDDPTLAPGTEKVKTTPYTGYKVRTFRNIYDANGKLISSAFEATSDYKVRNKVILRGTGGGASQPVQPQTPVVNPDISIPVTPPQEPAAPVTPAVPVEPSPEETVPIIVVPDLAV